MVVEILILGRDEGMLDQVRNFVCGQVKPSLARVFGKQASVRRVHTRHNRRLVILQYSVIGEVLLVLPYDAGEDCRRRDEHQRARRKYEADNPSDPAHLSIEPSIAPVGERARRRDEPELQRFKARIYETLCLLPDAAGFRSNPNLSFTLSCSSKANL